ncbi:MAG: cation transporter dimerization domain-containing protein, partial [Gammaproteobacteria bacterium]
LSTEESHRIANQVETMIEDKFQVGDAFIHVEPF